MNTEHVRVIYAKKQKKMEINVEKSEIGNYNNGLKTFYPSPCLSPSVNQTKKR